MIYTITLNPALDYVLEIDNIDFNGVNKIKKNNLILGGKGINASWMLTNLNIDNKALYFSGGSTGDMFNEIMAKTDISFKNFNVDFDTRINVKVNSNSNNLELNGDKKEIKKIYYKNLLNYLKDNLKEDDYVLIMGSYFNIKDITEILKVTNKIGAKSILDIAGKDLVTIIKKYKVYFAKPNEDEIKEMFDLDNVNDENLIKSAKKLISNGLENVLISLGSKGSIFVNDSNTFQILPAKINLINPVGAGDSTVAGFTAGMSQNMNIKESLILANACGGATASVTDIADKRTVEKLKNSITIKEIFKN